MNHSLLIMRRKGRKKSMLRIRERERKKSDHYQRESIDVAIHQMLIVCFNEIERRVKKSNTRKIDKKNGRDRLIDE